MGCQCISPARSAPFNVLGREALQTAQPQRGGYKCAADEDSANDIFHEYMTGDRLIFVKK
jgi:hypothetical protein